MSRSVCTTVSSHHLIEDKWGQLKRAVGSFKNRGRIKGIQFASVMPEINLIDFFTYFRGEPHQKEAVQLLQSAMPDSLLRNKCSWVTKWRETPEPRRQLFPRSAWTSLLSSRDFELRLTCAQRVCQRSATAAPSIQMVNG